MGPHVHPHHQRKTALLKRRATTGSDMLKLEETPRLPSHPVETDDGDQQQTHYAIRGKRSEMMSQKEKLMRKKLQSGNEDDSVLPSLQPNSRDPWKRAIEVEKRMKAMVLSKEEEARNIEKQVIEWKSRCEALEHQVKSQAEENNRKTAQLQHLTIAVRESHQENQHLQAQIQDLTTNIQAKDDYTLNLERQLQEQQVEIIELRKNQRPKTPAASMNEADDLERCQEQIAQLQAQVHATQIQLEATKEEASVALLRAKTESSHLLRVEQSARQSAQEELQKMRHQSYYDGCTLKEKNQQNAELKKANTELESWKKQQVQELTQAYAQATAMKTEIEQLKADVHGSETAKAQVTLLLEQHQVEMQTLKTSLDQAKERVKSLEGELTTQTTQINALEAQVSTQQEQIQHQAQAAQEREAERKAEEDLMAERLQKLQNEVDASITDALRTENLCLKTRASKVEYELAEAQKKLKLQQIHFEAELGSKSKEAQVQLEAFRQQAAELHRLQLKWQNTLKLTHVHHQAHIDTAKAHESVQHLEKLVKMATTNDLTAEATKYKLLLEASQEENNLLRFSSSAAESQIKKYDPVAAENITMTRRSNIQRVHDRMKAAQQDLEQRAAESSTVNSERLKTMLSDAKLNLETKQNANESSLQRVLDVIQDETTPSSNINASVPTEEKAPAQATASVELATTVESPEGHPKEAETTGPTTS